jgi:hypothetical protein
VLTKRGIRTSPSSSPNVAPRKLYKLLTNDCRANHEADYDTRSLLRPLDSNIALRPLSISDYESAGQRDTADHSSIKSFETFESSASGSSFSKGLKNLGARIRRKPLPRYLRGSIRRHAAADIKPARIGRGVWKDQLLSDRSFRTMAALMTVFAFGSR